ncbi:MAG: hypothetical protein KBA81_04840 [Rhabdochlamydiaceae bacterium]|nr:hypothetical protein [Rhabdochlamydiaceae bacterium]
MQIPIGNFYYIYGSGASQPNRVLQFWEDDKSGESGAFVFAISEGETKQIGILNGKDIIIEQNSTTDRMKALMARRNHEVFSLKPDSTFQEIPSEIRKNIFSKLDPRGPWKVSIQNHIGNDPLYEKVIKVSLFNAS